MREAAGNNFAYPIYYLEPGVAEAEIEADLRAFFERTGISGCLNSYRALDRTWERSAHVAGASIDISVLFLAGSGDQVVGGATAEQLEAMMLPVVKNLEVRLYDGAGHWIQRERSAEVNAAILRFIR
jgi:pimeloyl-ACP methyl ester carboxylesterase